MMEKNHKNREVVSRGDRGREDHMPLYLGRIRPIEEFLIAELCRKLAPHLLHPVSEDGDEGRQPSH